MRGIDVSNWQTGLVPSLMGIDFCIAKATEGVGFTDPACDGFIQDCIANGIKWGFYHFARENEPENEADYFCAECENYFGNGIPVLDYETNNYSNVEWCERFINRVHDNTGIWCMIYLSASQCAEYHGSWLPFNCGLWVAGYPYSATEWVNKEMPYNVEPFFNVTMWQFTSSLQLNGWQLDGNISYIDAETWDKYARSESNVPDLNDKQPKTCEQLAQEVLEGKWGTSWNRQNALDGAYGAGTYEHVQQIVNRLVG